MSKTNVAMGKDESVVSNSILALSLVLFFIKSSFQITQKRVIAQVPNLYWIIPVGKNTVTYPLNNIAGVRLDNKLFIKRALLGIGSILLSFFDFRSMFPFFFIGIFIIITSLEVLIIIQNNSGSSMTYPVSPLEKAKAQQFVNELNQAIVDNM